MVDDEELAQHPATTEDIRVCCQDIRVLGRKELRYAAGWAWGPGALEAGKAMMLDLWEEDIAVLKVWGRGLSLLVYVAET